MIIKIKAQVSTRYVGSKVEDEIEIEVDDNSTEEEIEKIAEDVTREWMFDQIDWGYKIEKQ